MSTRDVRIVSQLKINQNKGGFTSVQQHMDGKATMEKPIWNMDVVVVEARLAPHIQCLFRCDWTISQAESGWDSSRTSDIMLVRLTLWIDISDADDVVRLFKPLEKVTTVWWKHPTVSLIIPVKHMSEQSTALICWYSRVWLGSEVALLLFKENYLCNFTLFIGFGYLFLTPIFLFYK